jgi:SAM-dependent methyltransferase
MERHVYEEMNALERAHWWFLARREIIAHVVERWVPEHGAVLDVGCGTGFVLERLRQRYEVHGIDAAQVAVDFCHDKGLPNVQRGELGVTDLGRKDFDLVTFLDVLEHLDDDVDALKRARTLLKDDGHLVVTVPAFPFLWSQHDVVHHHRRRYVREELERTIRAAGFEPLHVTYFNTVLFPLIAGARLAAKALGRDDGSDASHAPSPLVNWILKRAFVAEKSVVPRARLPFGVSLLCVARVSATSNVSTAA